MSQPASARSAPAPVLVQPPLSSALASPRSSTTGVLGRLLALVLVAAALGACSGDDPASETSRTPAPVVTVEEVPASSAVATRVRVGPVVGRLSPRSRRALVRKATPLVDRWIDDKWVGGEWPRDIAGDFPGFTQGATRAARRDLAVTTAADLAGRVDGVEVVRRAVRLEVLAVDRRPVGVTARVALDFTTSGQASRTVSVRGRLLLTRVRGTWKVFGYDLTQGKR